MMREWKVVFPLYLLFLQIQTSWADVGSCFFSYTFNQSIESQVFGENVVDVETPCLAWFKVEKPGYFRIDINNKIFASKRDKKSCLSEYVIIKSDDTYTKLCHSNVTLPIKFKYFQGEVTVLIKWVGKLVSSTSYLGRVNYEEAAERPRDTEDDISAKLHKSISDKLKIFLKQKNQDHRIPDIKHFKYKSAEDCNTDQGVICKHSRFCADEEATTSCNSSLYLCLPYSSACNGYNDCLDGDLSDESGCYLPYVLLSTGGVVLSITLLGSIACFIQHHKVMIGNDMVRFNNDLVRRKDKVKARKADKNSCNRNEIRKRNVSIDKLPNINGKKTIEKNPSKASLLSRDEVSSKKGSIPVSKTEEINMKEDEPVAELNSLELKPTNLDGTNNSHSDSGIGVTSSPPPPVDPPGVTTPSSINESTKTINKPESKLSTDDAKPNQVKCKTSPSKTTLNTDNGKSIENEGRIKTLSRKDKKILADEREINREHRKESMTSKGSQDNLTQTDVFDNPITQLQLMRMEEIGITPIRRPICRDSSSGSLLEKSENVGEVETLEKSGYGYRLDFRGSSEFQLTEDAYI